jgi:uncharacterized protein YecE (DUF72 family)
LPVLKVIGNIAYFRLRKDVYDTRSVDEWSGQIRNLAKDAQETYVYLRHDKTGANAALALRLREGLEQKG